MFNFGFLENGLEISTPTASLNHILWMNFQEKLFSYYILLTDQILLPDWLYLLRYLVICVL